MIEIVSGTLETISNPNGSTSHILLEIYISLEVIQKTDIPRFRKNKGICSEEQMP